MQKTNQPLLSICIPTFNRAEILRETLAHLAETLDTSIEIVVSDSRSGDHTVDVLEDFKKKWERFRYVRLDKEIPMMENLVVAGSMAMGKYMYLFCDDDRIVIEGLNKAVKMMEEREDIVGVFGSYMECDPKKETVKTTYKKTDEIVILPKGLESKKHAICKLGLLLSPVIRTELCQRFCITTFDNRSFDHWQFVGGMLDHGAIALIPDVFFIHMHTVPRAEYDLTEGWYHDMYRADLEVYVGKIGCGSPENAAALGIAAGKAYLLGVRFSELKGESLTGRHFLLRARAYGLVNNETALEYEQVHLKRMVAERLNILISAVPGVRKVILESHPISQEACSLLEKIMPEMEVCTVSREELLELPTRTENFIVAWEYQTLLDRSSKLEVDPLHQCSLKDVFANCRLLPGEITFD